MNSLGLCNPPRKAKRTSYLSPSPSSTTSPEFTATQEHNNKRGGRKAGNLSRAAREAQRKANHSLIEKARRTKINEALTTLRSLIPAADDDTAHTEREFKLEILERAVAHLQDLKSRLHVLESAEHLCRRCSAPLKRKRTLHNDGYEADNDVGAKDTPQLPSLSTWLHLVDPSLPLTPNESPQARTTSSWLGLAPQSLLLSPKVFHQTPPALTLPPPSLKPFPKAAHRPVPPSPEDRSAATLLLQIASSPSSSHVDPKKSEMKPQTPSSILGLVRDE